MNCHPLRLLCGAFVLCCAAAQAQPANSNPPAPAATPADTAKTAEAPLQLSPFTVDAKKDVGFVAATSLAGGRLASELKDTPVAYSVLTREFIDALNVPDLSAAAKWTVNANNVNDDGRGVMFADELGTKLSFRGVQSTGTTVSQQQIDFFPVYYDYDSYNLERFDFARGPNSILFGNGSNGGTPNAMVKRARPDKAFDEVRATYASWGNARATVDVNVPITAQFAARVNALWQNADTWRDREFNKKTAASLALSYQPFAHTQLRFNAEHGRFDRNIALATDGDRISGWDGTTTFTGTQPVATLPGNANALGITRLGSSTAPYPVYSPSFGGGLMNFANTAATLGGNANGAVPVGGQLVVGAGANYAGGPILDTANLPGNAFALATAGSQFRVPGRSFTPGTTDRPSFIQGYSNYTLIGEQQVGEHLFLNVAGNYTQGQKTTDYTTVRGLNDVFIDINRTLPSGAVNPNYLIPYDESVRFQNVTNFDAHGYRGSAAFVFNNTGWGDFRLNLEAGQTLYTTPRIQYVYTVKDPNLDSRDWPANNNVRYRYYWNNPSRPENDLGTVSLVDPVSGVTRTVDTGFVLDSTRQNNTSRTKADFKYGQAAVNATLFHGKLNLLGALRRDDYKSVADQSLFRRDYAAGWDGRTFIWRPRPPSDYFTLQYTPKDGAGNPTAAPTNAVTRPRDGNGNPLPQYAGDRFQSDYSSPIVKGQLTTYSSGGVYHLFNWLSVFGNYAETYNPPSPSIRINNQVFAPLLSKGWDAGVRFNLLGDKLALTVLRYSGKQDNVTVGTGTGDGLAFGLSGLFNSIIDANVIGDQSASGINKRGLQEVPAVYFDIASRKSKGTEFELTANPLPGWRLLANLAFPETTQSGAYADTRAYIAANTNAMKQILSDAGVVLNGNVASVDQSIPVNQQSPDASAAAAAWNNLQAVSANFVTAEQKLTRLAISTANVFSDYTVQTGKLKGFRFGGGVNFRGKEVIGFRGADTIVDPNNANAAIDDPRVDALTPVYRKRYYTATAVFGYAFKFQQRYTMVVDFSIDNVFGEDLPLYYNTAQRPPGGAVTSPARVATPFQYSYLMPRNYALSVTLKF
jgi:outer membrane receptor protein involved in Fe transport